MLASLSCTPSNFGGRMELLITTCCWSGIVANKCLKGKEQNYEAQRELWTKEEEMIIELKAKNYWRPKIKDIFPEMKDIFPKMKDIFPKMKL